jgi:streptogramin lyase
MPGIASGQTFYVSSGNHDNPTIDRIDSTGMVSVFATQSIPNSYFYGLAFGSSGDLYVADTGTSQVDMVNSAGAISLFASLPSGTRLSGLALDNNNNVYVADYTNDQIWKISGVVTLYTSWFTTPSTVTGLAVDSSNDLFTGNYNDGKIYKIAPPGTMTIFATGVNSPTFITMAPVPGPSTWAMLALGIPLLLASLHLSCRWAGVGR